MAREADSFSRDITKIQMGILLISLVSFVASFNPEWKLWGPTPWCRFPVILRVALLILLMLVLLPRVQQKIGQKLTKHFANLSITAVTSYYFIMAAILLGLFVLMTSNNHLLGDGFQILEILLTARIRRLLNF